MIEDEDTKPLGRLLPKPLTHVERIAMFGHFAFTPHPQPDNPERIEIAEPWVKDNTHTVIIPQLNRGARVHVLIEKQFLALWAAWEAAGLLNRILTFDGAWSSRFKRGRAGGTEQDLSNHCWATAFDVNAQWNPLGHTPPLMGQKGSTRELEPIANAHGFAWGGRFTTRPDGMHFEAFKVLS